MRVDEQTLGECVEAALRAWPTYKAYACPGSLDARDMVRAALATLPQPEPVPGSAVRALVAWFRKAAAQTGESLYDDCASQLAAALAADGLAAAVALPSAECVGRAILDVYNANTHVESPVISHVEFERRIGRCAIELLARRPATDEAEALRRRLEHAEDILRDLASYVGNGGYNAPDPIDLEVFRRKIRDGIDADQRVQAQVASRKCPTCDSPSPRLHPAVQSEGEVHICKDAYHLPGEVERLGLQLASVTKERDELQGAQVLNRSAIAGLKRERDEALLKAERAQVSCQAAIDDARKACAARDEALAKLAAVEMERDRWEETANCISVDASAKLAARPEPVVIDDALAEHMCLRRGTFMACCNDAARAERVQHMKADLIAVFGGDRASVSVPQAEPDDGVTLPVDPDEGFDAGWAKGHARGRAEGNAERDQLRAELERAKAYIASMEELGEKQSGIAQSLRAELERTRTALEATQGELEDALGNRDLQQLRDELADCKSRLEGYQRTNRELRDKWNAELREAGRLGRELEKTRAELVACKRGHASEVGAFQSLVRRFRELSKQHDALRAACEWGDFKLCDGWTSCEYNTAHLRKLDCHATAEYIDRIQAALLKPAPAWQHISSDGDAHTFQHGETGRMTTLEGFATWQEAAQCLDEPAPAEVETVPMLAGKSPEWWAEKARAEGDSEVGAGVQHPPPESAMVDADDPDLPESLRTHLNNRAAESAVVDELPPDRHIERAVAALAERVERLERAR